MRTEPEITSPLLTRSRSGESIESTLSSVPEKNTHRERRILEVLSLKTRQQKGENRQEKGLSLIQATPEELGAITVICKTKEMCIYGSIHEFVSVE